MNWELDAEVMSITFGIRNKKSGSEMFFKKIRGKIIFEERFFVKKKLLKSNKYKALLFYNFLRSFNEWDKIKTIKEKMSYE